MVDLPDWMPKDVPEKEFETHSLLGPYFRFSIFPVDYVSSLVRLRCKKGRERERARPFFSSIVLKQH